MIIFRGYLLYQIKVNHILHQQGLFDKRILHRGL